MANIISGDPTCAVTICGRLIAQVDCIKYIMQGTSVCIDIQFFGVDGKALDLAKFADIQIQLTNELDCVIANFWYPGVPTGSRGFDIEILQYNTTSGTMVNKGLLRICLSKNCTFTSPGMVSAEILLREMSFTGGESYESFGIRCLQIAKITESKIAKNGGDSGCFPGYIPPQPSSSGIGFAIGSTGSTGFIGATGPPTLNNYASFIDNTDQLIISENVPQRIGINTEQLTVGIRLDDQINGRIIIENPGVYLLTFRVQLANTDNSNEHYADIWLRFMGSDYPDSNTRIFLSKAKNSVLHSYAVASVNFIGTSVNPNDYVELWWATDSTSILIETIPAGVVPLTPSVICTLSQIR